MPSPARFRVRVLGHPQSQPAPVSIPYHHAMSRLDVPLEFLQRALGFGEEGDPQTVEVFPEALPNGLPFRLPPLPGLRVIGGVRSTASRWSFNGGHPSPEQRMWRVFLDVDGDLPGTMQAFQTVMRAQGWEASRPFMRTFVERSQPNWLAVQPAHRRQLNLNLRQEGAVTQVWLQVMEIDQQTAEHLLDPSFHFSQYQAPLPVLMLPAGWRARMGQGSSGSVSSEDYRLQAPQHGNPDLLPYLLPQLEAQGWHLIHQQVGTSVFQTAQGIGTLFLNRQGQGWKAVIVHATAEDGRGGQRTVASFQ